MFDHRQIEHDRTNPAQTHLSTSTNFDDHDEQTLQFRPNNHQFAVEGDDSGVCSPPLWKNSPTTQPLLSHHTNRSLSPNSRAQAILRGQFELMEMVKNMPESSYELSLKDLVENPKTETQTEEKLAENLKQRKQSKRVGEKGVTMMRSESFETKGLFLNVGFPFCWLRSKKKKNFGGGGSNSSGKVSPKPHEGLKGGERDWWKKKFTGSSDSDSSKISSNSGSSGTTVSRGGSGSSGRSYSGGGRKKNGRLSGGCWPCFNSRSS